MKHKVKIAVSNGGKKTQVLTSGSSRIPMRLLRWLTPGKTVQGVEIQEVTEGVDFSGNV